MADIVYLNGELLPSDRARLSPFDHGFLYGYGLFETMRAYGGRVFRLERHLARLRRSAHFLGLALEGLDLEKAVTDTLRANGLADARLRLTVSAGEGQAIPDPATCHRPTVLVTATSYQPPQSYEKGWSAIISSIRRNSQSPLSRMKGIAYIENVLARQQAKNAGADEALVLNEKGLLAEASTSNIFLVAGGLLLTPRDEDGVLPGITRDTTLELAQALGLSAAQACLTSSDLASANEAFITNSLIEIMPLVKVDGRPIGSGAPGPVTARLMAAYRELVQKETASG